MQAAGKGESLSAAFEAYATPFGFPDWPDFHRTWTAVRTKFIDDRIKQAGRFIFKSYQCCKIVSEIRIGLRSFPLQSILAIQVAGRDRAQALQVVNLGAGMDTRACRMECYREFERGFEVDLQKGGGQKSDLGCVAIWQCYNFDCVHTVTMPPKGQGATELKMTFLPIGQ